MLPPVHVVEVSRSESDPTSAVGVYIEVGLASNYGSWSPVENKIRSLPSVLGVCVLN